MCDNDAMNHKSLHLPLLWEVCVHIFFHSCRKTHSHAKRDGVREKHKEWRAESCCSWTLVAEVRKFLSRHQSLAVGLVMDWCSQLLVQAVTFLHRVEHINATAPHSTIGSETIICLSALHHARVELMFNFPLSSTTWCSFIRFDAATGDLLNEQPLVFE